MQMPSKKCTIFHCRFLLSILVLATVSLKFQLAWAISPEVQSPASLGAGGAYASIVDDESAFFQNPAGTGRNINRRQIFAENHFLNAANRWNLKAGFIDGVTEAPFTFGFLFSTLHTIERKKEDYIANTSINWDNFIMIGLSHHLLRMREALRTRSKWAFGLDAGILAFPFEFLAIGVSFRNFYRTFESVEELPRVLMSGISLNFKDIRIGFDAERNFSSQSHEFRCGIEYSLLDFTIIRAGYFTDRHGSQKGYTTGVQLHYMENVSADFAFVDFLQSNDSTYSMGLKFNF